MSSLVRATVRVPCSTSNLGSGYDTIGLALDRYLTAVFEPGDHELRLERAGTLARMDDPEEPDLVLTAFVQALERDGITPGGTLSLDSEIPIARGLGSSAAARLAGFDLALAVRELPADPEAAFATAYDHEGHGDNIAPCLHGGLRAVLPGEGRPKSIALELSHQVGFAYAAPAAGISTEVAREALPASVGHDMAARSLGRVTALARGLATADAELIKIGAEDELHVPHRLPMIPGAFNALGAGYDAGAWAVTISGAGSGLIAICPVEAAEEVASAMHAVFANGSDDPDCVGFALRPDFEGLTRLD